VTRVFEAFAITDFQKTKIQMLNWANRFSIFCFLDNHNYQLAHSSVECLLGAGAIDKYEATAGNALPGFQDFFTKKGDWLFGHFSYDLKNEMEALHSAHPDHIHFPDIFFFVPEVVMKLSAGQLIIGSIKEAPSVYFDEVRQMPTTIAPQQLHAQVKSRFSRTDYITTIEALRQHILRGDCYEINFCQEFYDDDCQLDPLATYQSLSEASPNPFSAFYRVQSKYLLCASPERFLKRTGNQVYSQPIKGTSKRDLDNKDADSKHKTSLKESSKDRAENVMVVDLVRNDLSRICKEGRVEVEELFGVYSFPQVHQMISTIKGELLDHIGIADIIRATFPMGSMTGAPKLRVMELIEQYERTRRGIFSGAVGYFEPGGDFDLNVVIRSILYNADEHYLSFPAGSGITFYSDPAKEYEECLLKAEAIKKVLTG
jgi:para-aminobenzoate synthetase component I